MYTKILVPLDGSSVAEQVLPYARFWCRRLTVPVELLGVIDGFGSASSVDAARKAHYVEKLVDDTRRASEAYLELVGSTFPRTLITYSVETGKPAEVIIEKAAYDKGTLVAMATHGRSGMSRWLLGSVTEKVLRATANPLLLVRSGEGGKSGGEVKFESIVVPLDTSKLAESVLPDVIDLAQRLNLEVILVHVCAVPLSAYYGAEDYYNPHYQDLAAQLKQEAGHYLERKVRELKEQGLERVSAVVFEGSAADEIIAFARRESNSLVAMCTHGYSGVKHWVLGSVAEKVVRHSGDPVLVVRAA
jgi:nucleotide-binding universal stress UspA family protein